MTDKNPNSGPGRILLGILLSIGAIFLAGCDLTIKNLTPEDFSENPSQVYTITIEARPRGASIRSGSVRPHIVIDGDIHPMTQSGLGGHLYEYDYHLPAGRQQGAYYFLINYEYKSGDKVKEKEKFTGLFKFKILNRYALSLEVNRAPVGAKVAILGRGFTQQDVVLVDSQPARTVFESSTSLSFYVPAVSGGRNHTVSISGGMNVGTLRIDASSIHVTPSSLSIQKGGQGLLAFSTPSPAPPGGLLIDVTTDIPSSVIMPEVIIPEGARSVSISITGGEPGVGALYIISSGAEEIIIPISVN
ncbi:MAG: IPT/TIG domain-containing protein [Opitutaceae bacterium]|nr:IPT/TIG domain-containing protein [Opitutaceae bacterium]